MASEATKDKLENTLLRLCETSHLSKITVTQLLAEAGVSRSVFYNAYRDLNDFIHYIYWEKIISPQWPGLNKTYDDYLAVCIIVARKLKNRYGTFFMQAMEMRGQNSLRDYIMKRSVDFEFNMAKEFYDESQYPQLRYACEFYAYGWTEARYEWIRSGYQTPVKDFAKQICDARFALLTWFMFDIEKSKQFMACDDLAEIKMGYKID